MTAFITLLLRQKLIELKRSLSPFWELEMSILLCMFGLFPDKQSFKKCNVKKNNFKCTKFIIKN